MSDNTHDKEKKEGIDSIFENPDRVLKLDKDTNLEQIEEFFKDSDEEEETSVSEEDHSFELVDGPSEAEKEMFQEDMKKFKADVRQEREKYQPSTSEKIFAMVKSLILRAIIFYFVLWLLRRNSSSRPLPSQEAQTASFDDDELEDLIQNDEL